MSKADRVDDTNFLHQNIFVASRRPVKTDLLSAGAFKLDQYSNKNPCLKDPDLPNGSRLVYPEPLVDCVRSFTNSQFRFAISEGIFAFAKTKFLSLAVLRHRFRHSPSLVGILFC